jgi:hypothetical protein
MAHAGRCSYSDDVRRVFAARRTREEPPMIRRLYLATLVALQVALIVMLAPPLAEALRVGPPTLADDAVDVARTALGVVAIAATALALAFPGFALLRHRRRGVARYAGLPRWTVATALAGGAVFAVAATLAGVARAFDSGDAPDVAELAACAANAGLALMAAGALCAEVLRRSVRLPKVVASTRHATSTRVEVVAPADLATRAA